jgi:hypothetical protein
VEDEDLRQNIWQAYESSRDAINRLSNGKSPSKQIFDDKKLQKDLKAAAESIRDASVMLREAPKRRRKGGIGRLLLVGVVGTALALALSEDLRNKALDLMFGAEEEFDYTSTTTAPPPPTTTAAASFAACGRDWRAGGAESSESSSTSRAASAPAWGTRTSRGPAARKSGTSKPALRRRMLGTPSSSKSPWISSASAWLRPPATRTSAPSV